MQADPSFGKKKNSKQPSAKNARKPVFITSENIETQTETSTSIMTNQNPPKAKVHLPPRKRMAQPKPLASMNERKQEEPVITAPVEEVATDLPEIQQEETLERFEADTHEREIIEVDEADERDDEIRPTRQWDLKFALGLIALVVIINLGLTLFLSDDADTGATQTADTATATTTSAEATPPTLPENPAAETTAATTAPAPAPAAAPAAPATAQATPAKEMPLPAPTEAEPAAGGSPKTPVAEQPLVKSKKTAEDVERLQDAQKAASETDPTVPAPAWSNEIKIPPAPTMPEPVKNDDLLSIIGKH